MIEVLLSKGLASTSRTDMDTVRFAGPGTVQKSAVKGVDSGRGSDGRWSALWRRVPELVVE